MWKTPHQTNRWFRGLFSVCVSIAIFLIGLDGCGDEKPRINKNPIVEITYPIDQTAFNEADHITFASISSDEEDGSLPDASLVWNSSIDGQIGTGRSITRNDLSAGKHTVKLIATDSAGAIASDSVTIQIKTPTIEHPITQGSKTTGVANPENAFDGNFSTAATIDRYWGENGHLDYLHFVTFIGEDDRLTFKISTVASSQGSIIMIEGEISADSWEEIHRFSLDRASSKIITITNAQKFADPKGCVSLRARWIGGSQNNDFNILEIARKPSPTSPTTLTLKVIIIDIDL